MPTGCRTQPSIEPIGETSPGRSSNTQMASMRRSIHDWSGTSCSCSKATNPPEWVA